MTTIPDTLTLDQITASRPRKRKLGPLLVTGLVLMGALILVGIIAPFFFREAAETLTDQTRQAPSADHWLGTDEFGRDVFARTLTATQLTLLLTFAASTISLVGGIVIGTLVWMIPAKIRTAILSVNAVAVAFPSLVLALVVAAILGAGAWPAVIAIGIANVPAFIRLTANMSAPIMQRDYVLTARLLRVPQSLVVKRHVLPNIAEPLLILAASNFVVTLIELSGLSFIGLGVQSPEYDFGKLLSDGLVAIYTAPWVIIGPSIMIVLTGLAAMLIGDGLASRANPRTQRTFKGRTGILRPNAVGQRTAARINEHAAEPGSAQRGSEPAAADAVVSVRDLRVTGASGVPLVKGISFDVKPGEILGLVGESGSGKSLTAMSVANLVPEGVISSAAELTVGAHDMLREPAPAQLAQDIALVYQDPISTFNPSLRLGTQLTEAARSHFGMSRRESREALIKKFEQLHITDPKKRVTQHPHELSGGMLQRAMIASSLMAAPKLIIADEPTTALDVTVQAEVLRQFVTVTEDLGAAMLFISHDLGVVEALCDRVLVMYHGEIVEEVTAQQLRDRDVTHPYTKKLLAAAEYVEATE